MAQLVDLETFNTNNIIFSKAEVNQIPGQKLTYKRIKINYSHPDGNITDLILGSPSNLMCWGLSESTDPVSGSLSGYQCAIQLWNRNSPSNEEKRFTQMIDDITKTVKEHLVKEDTKDQIERYDLELSDLKKMQPLYYKQERGVRVPDKGPTLYGKCLYSKKENKIQTFFVNEVTNEPVAPLEILNKHMFVRFALKVESIFIGSNAISLQLKLSEVSFRLKDSSLRSLLAPDLLLNQQPKKLETTSSLSMENLKIHDEKTNEDDNNSEYEVYEEVEEEEEENVEENVHVIKKNIDNPNPISSNLLEELETNTEVVHKQPLIQEKVVSNTNMTNTKKRATKTSKK